MHVHVRVSTYNWRYSIYICIYTAIASFFSSLCFIGMRLQIQVFTFLSHGKNYKNALLIIYLYILYALCKQPVNDKHGSDELHVLWIRL